MPLLIAKESLDGLPHHGRALRLRGLTGHFIRRLLLALDTFGASPRLFLAGLAELLALVGPAQMLPARAAFIKFIARVGAAQGMPNENGDDWRVLDSSIRAQHSGGIVESQAQN